MDEAKARVRQKLESGDLEMKLRVDKAIRAQTMIERAFEDIRVSTDDINWLLDELSRTEEAFCPPDDTQDFCDIDYLSEAPK